ncbi:hypothetical protein CF327_g4205 [Tilletia walkeri]|nr:hypothetical protein CF327_g4205 [Tilletia walkeri]KAE8226182.1 hypothetical protein CF326_g7740 [Tilletia indica]
MNNVKNNGSNGKKLPAEGEQSGRRVTRQIRAASEAPPSQLGSTSVQAGRDIRLEAGARLFVTSGDLKLVN